MASHTPALTLRRRLRGLPSSFTSAQARAEGVSSRDLRRLQDAEILSELSRGVFRKAEAPESAHLDLIAISLRAPFAVICLESALALHELIDDIPSSTHIAVPRNTWPPKIDYPPVTVSRFDPITFDLGVEAYEISEDEHVWVYSPARSVADAMRLRHQVGDTLALHALGRYLRRTGHRGVPELLDIANQLRVEAPIRTAVEAVLA